MQLDNIDAGTYGGRQPECCCACKWNESLNSLFVWKEVSKGHQSGSSSMERPGRRTEEATDTASSMTPSLRSAPFT